MAAYSKKMVSKIAGLVKSDTYTIAEICGIVGISLRTYFRWMQEHPEFADAVERAKDERMQKLVVEARKSLLRKITGYDVEETHTVVIPNGEKGPDGKPKGKVKEKKTGIKHIQPDTMAIIFTLTNGDSENFKNKHSIEATGKDGKDLFESKSISELKEDLDGLMRIINGGE